MAARGRRAAPASRASWLHARAGRTAPAGGARPTGTRRPCRSAGGRRPRGRRAARRSMVGSAPPKACGSRASSSPMRARTTAGSTPTRVRMGPAMPSDWSSTAASRWAGVTSALVAAWPARSAAEKRLLGLERPALGIEAHRDPPFPCGGRRVGAGRDGHCDSGTRSRRYWRWVTATASRAAVPGWRRARPASRSTSAWSSRTRRTPSRLRPALVSCWIWRSRSRSRSENRRLPPLVRRRVQQSLALVDAQGLGMDAGQLGGHRDHVHRPATVGRHVRRLTVTPPGTVARRLARSPRASASTAARCSSVSSAGTSTSTVTSRSPVRRSCRARHAPTLDPEGPARRGARRHPQGHRVAQGGHGHVVPSAASGNPTGTVRVRLRPRRPNRLCRPPGPPRRGRRRGRAAARPPRGP